jgi:hypothetical protein
VYIHPPAVGSRTANRERVVVILRIFGVNGESDLIAKVLPSLEAQSGLRLPRGRFCLLRDRGGKLGGELMGVHDRQNIDARLARPAQNARHLANGVVMSAPPIHDPSHGELAIPYAALRAARDEDVAVKPTLARREKSVLPGSMVNADDLAAGTLQHLDHSPLGIAAATASVDACDNAVAIVGAVQLRRRNEDILLPGLRHHEPVSRSRYVQDSDHQVDATR